MKDYAQEFKPDIKEFHTATKAFYENSISAAEYKKISGGFGSYAERGGVRSMLRLRLPGGMVTKGHLKFITDSIQKYGIGLIHLTTCQTIQLHHLTADTVCSLIEEAWAHGIITRGGGGNFPRNVLMSPLSGVRKGEPFDVSGCVSAASDYLLGFIHTVTLPRKLKVCFSNDTNDLAHAAFRDLGFVAKNNGTFDVYSAGGLGPNPKMGVLTARDVPPEQALFYIKAMVDTFAACGNYKIRAKARTRYMQDTPGTEKYLEVYRQKLTEALESKLPAIATETAEMKKQGNGTLFHPRAIPQKQPGLYAVSYHPIGGCLAGSALYALYDAILPMEEVQIRLSPDEGMYLINCTAEEAETLLKLTEDGAATLFETSTACIGNRICQLGLRDSQALLKTCTDALRPYHFESGVLPNIHISGCPSSCGSHQAASLGFRGAVKQSANGPVAAYALYEGGCAVSGKETFGTEICVMPEENIPEFLIALGKQIRDASMLFPEWMAKHKSEFLKLAEKYSG